MLKEYKKVMYSHTRLKYARYAWCVACPCNSVVESIVLEIQIMTVRDPPYAYFFFWLHSCFSRLLS